MRIFAMRTLPFLTLALVAGGGGCTDEEIVYIERPPFNEPVDPASGFLGYYTSSAQQTTCGNCHADFQGSWAETGHAGAYQTLKSINAASTCYSCHTITERGNDATGVVGHDKVQDSTYYDVQCESCHGPGLEHVESVGAGNITDRPLAHIGVGPDTSAGCAACHNGTHHPYVEQWAASRHANVRSGSPTTSSTCVVCHEGRGKLAALGVNSNFAEKGVGGGPQPIACAVCHNPHGSTFPGNLRLSVSDPEPTLNLCMSCHLRRGEPSTSSSSPHGAQGAVLLGFAGWRPPGFVYDTARIYGSHATTANPNLCAGCHVSPFTVNDASGNFSFQSVGHLFKPIPCLDSQGRPTGDNTCAYTATARNWSSCTKSGCHASATAAASAFTATRTEIQFLADLLWIDQDGDEAIDAYNNANPASSDRGFLPKIMLNNPADFSTSDAVISGANGTEFNVRTCAEHLTGHPDGSKGTHNKFLCVALLAQSASYLQTLYNYLPTPPPATAALLEKYSGRIQAPGLQIRREKFPVTVE
jgi:predicted CXXCH cytochrome family protein